MPGSLSLGIDIGGTKVAAGLIDPRGEIVFKTRVPMIATGDAATGFSAVRSAIEAVYSAHSDERQDVRAIGICAPGPLDPHTGVILNPPNVPCWRDFPLGAEIEKAFGVTARVDNDGNAAALAEVLWGAGIGYKNVFYATLGTGIGTGIIFDKQIYHGRTGSAAEGGHNTIDFRGPLCGCGKRGCIEILAAGPAISRRARTKCGDSDSASRRIQELAGGSLDQIRAEHVGLAFHEGDPLAHEILSETADLLAIWLGNIVDLLEPDVMIVGGGVAELMSAFFPRIIEHLPRWSVNPRAHEIPLVRARYSADAGIVGAAALCQ